METVIVLFIVATAAVYLIRRFSKPLTGKGGGCACGSAGCSASGSAKTGPKTSFKTKGKLVELNPRRIDTCGCATGKGCDCEPDDGVPTSRLQ